MAEPSSSRVDLEHRGLPDYGRADQIVCHRCNELWPCTVARLQAQFAELTAWRKAVSGAIKCAPWFEKGEWAGDKEGWGYHFEMVGWLIRENASLQADLEHTSQIVAEARAVVLSGEAHACCAVHPQHEYRIAGSVFVALRARLDAADRAP